MSLVDYCKRVAEAHPIPEDMPSITLEKLIEFIKNSNKYEKENFGDIRHFTAFVVLLYPEHTEYVFGLKTLTDNERSDCLRKWFPVFKLDIGQSSGDKTQ